MLMTESNSSRFHLRALRVFSALTLFAGASSLAVHAQQSAPLVAGVPQLVAGIKTAPLDLSTVAGVNYSSSSDSVETPVDALAAERLNLAEGLQPPPRRRYGRPRYNDSSHNPDGSNKYTFVAGVGFTAPTGNTFHYLNTNYGVQVGGGRNFNKNFGVLAQFDYDAFGFNGRTLYNEQSIFNYGITPGNPNYLGALDGNSHIWSLTVNPILNIYQNQGLGAYVVGGVGFYHKVANFTTPVNSYACPGYPYGCYPYTANEIIDHYTSNAPGFNGGFGLTFKPSRFAGERLFVEARYVFIDNSQRSGITVANINSTFGQSYTGTNLYPANSNRTTYTVYKAGIRF